MSSKPTKPHWRAKAHQILGLRGKPKYIVDVHAYISEIRTSYPMLLLGEKRKFRVSPTIRHALMLSRSLRTKMLI